MFTNVLQELDLAKNEAILYETLVDKGDLSVSDLARESGINRRNIYDTLNRLLEKGLTYEVKLPKETIYKAVNPEKLRELLKEKEAKLESAIPELIRMYNETPRDEELYIYKGIEGWKNYLALQLHTGEQIYTIGGKGAFTDNKIKTYVEQIQKQQKEKGMVNKVLFDQIVKAENRAILQMFKPENYRFLPEGFDTSSTIDIFGNYVVIFGDLSSGEIDAKSSFTVVKNKPVAESFRTWFKLLWEQNA